MSGRLLVEQKKSSVNVGRKRFRTQTPPQVQGQGTGDRLLRYMCREAIKSDPCVGEEVGGCVWRECENGFVFVLLKQDRLNRFPATLFIYFMERRTSGEASHADVLHGALLRDWD